MSFIRILRLIDDFGTKVVSFGSDLLVGLGGKTKGVMVKMLGIAVLKGRPRRREVKWEMDQNTLLEYSLSFTLRLS